MHALTAGQDSRSGRAALAGHLLVLFAFAAWNLTGLANAALALLCVLFLLDLPRGWARLRYDPALWLLGGGLALTGLLALRAALIWPETAAAQWASISEWSRPLLFVVAAWWLRGDPLLARRVLAAALLGLVLGIARKSDSTDLTELVQGLRPDFGYSALGLGFLASVVLLGLVSFRGELLSLAWRGRRYPILGGALWVALALAFGGILLVTQARGAALALALVLAVVALVPAVATPAAGGGWRRGLGPALMTGLIVLTLAGTVLWASRDRMVGDAASLAQAQALGHQSYASSLGTRINLHRIGLALIAERPLLGWGPGTRGTQQLVPAGVLDLSDYDREHAPDWSHLHSVPIEVLVRFGLVGGLFGLAGLAVMGRAALSLRRRLQDEPLRRLLLLGSILTLFNCLYDFRLLNLDLGLFCVLFFGILYGLRLGVSEPRAG